MKLTHNGHEWHGTFGVLLPALIIDLLGDGAPFEAIVTHGDEPGPDTTTVATRVFGMTNEALDSNCGAGDLYVTSGHGVTEDDLGFGRIPVDRVLAIEVPDTDTTGSIDRGYPVVIAGKVHRVKDGEVSVIVAEGTSRASVIVVPRSTVTRKVP